jgi:glycosyltransferase involved in cell wall biosynthesis
MVLHVLPHPGGGGERYVEMLERVPGFRFRRFALSERRSPLEAWRRVKAARAEAGEADLVHVHGDAAAILCAPLLRERPGVITFHGFHLLRRTTGPARRLLAWRLRRSVRACRVAISTSLSEAEYAEAVAGARLRDRLVTIENGIDDPGPPSRAVRISERARHDLRDEDVAVVYAGQLEPRKGVLDILSGLESARAEGAPVVGLIAGEGPLAAEVAERAPAAGARYLGHRDDVLALLEAADVFVMPSEREGLSLAILEAMAKARACVVSDGPGNPDAVGEAGVVFSYGEPEALAAALVKLAGDPELRTRLGAAARERFLRRFLADRMAEEMRRAYERALGDRAGDEPGGGEPA